MATPPSALASAPVHPLPWRERIKPYLTPYYLAVAAVLGALTAGFVALIAVLVLVISNFNVLDWIE